MPPRPLVAVTGAASLVGRAAIAHLLASGWRVRQLLHDPPADLPPHAEAVVGTPEDGDALRRLVVGADAVVHCSGCARARGTARLYEANVEAARRVGLAVNAAARGCRLVVLSSLAARFPWLSAYAASKADGEDAIRDAAGAGRWMVLRLAPVYGPGDRKTLAVLEAALKRVMPVPDRPKALVSLLSVDDAAAAVAAACGADVKREVWELGDQARPWLALAEAAARAVAAAPVMVRLPPALMVAGAALVHPLGSREAPLLAASRLGELQHDDWAPRPERRPPAALWRPRVHLDAGLHRAAEWFRAHGWLPQPVALAVSAQRRHSREAVVTGQPVPTGGDLGRSRW
jgi:nucleoside-diphosphate-sugar epimerase